MRRPHPRRLWLAAALALGAPGPAAAGEPGTVRLELAALDAESAPLAGVRVVLRGGGSIPPRLTSGPAARVVFDGLGAGAWVVEVEGDGLAPAAMPLLLEPGETLRLEARLAARGSELSVVERNRATIGTPIGAARLRALPSSHDPWSLLETFEPVSIVDRQDNGGLFTGEPGRILAHGSSWTQTSFRLAGLDATDPDRTGTPLLSPPWDAFASLDLTTALLPVEHGGPGPLLTLTPRRPGSTWSGTLQANGLSDALQASNDRPGVPSIARFDSLWDGSGVVSGPLGERTGLLLAGSYRRSRRFERDRPERLEGESGGGLAHLVFTPRPGEELRLLAGHQRAAYPFPGRARYQGDPDQREAFSQASASWERRPARGPSWSLSAGWLRGRFDPQLAAAVPRAVERLTDGPIRELVRPADSRRQRLSLEARLRPDLSRFQDGRHALRLGASLSRNSSDTSAAGAAAPIPERVDGRPARVWEYGWAGESRWRSTELALWAADRVRLGSRLEVEAGLRFDLVDASAQGAETGISWASLSPRLSIRQRLTPGGRAVFFGGYARYHHRLPLDLLAFGDPAGPQGVVYRWADANGDGGYDASERGVRVALAAPGGPGVAGIDPDLKRPHADEFVLGLEGRITRDFSVRFTAIARRERDLVESVNTGVGPSDYRVRLLPDPSGDFDNPADDQLLPVFDRDPASFGRDRYLLTNPGADHSSRHEGVELVFEKRFGQRARLLVGATAHRSEGSAANVGFGPLENDQGVIGELFDQPNADSFARGRLFSDRAYSIHIAADARLPGDLLAGLVARYQDGQNFARLVVADGLSQGAELVRATPNGRHRFTFALTVDLRLEKGFQLGRARLAGVVEAFNLLNTANDVEEDPIARPAFRNPTAVQPPAVVRLGVRLDF